jgi:hypothetical protein
MNPKTKIFISGNREFLVYVTSSKDYFQTINLLSQNLNKFTKTSYKETKLPKY